MLRIKPRNDNGEELGKVSCTTEIQAAFILSSVVTFFSGLLILFVSRLLLGNIKKWQNIKKTGIILKLILARKNQNPRAKSLYLQGVFRDRIEMLLSAQTFVGQVLVLLVFVLSIGSLIIYFINSSDPVGSCSSYEDKTIPIDLSFNAFFAFYFGLRFLAADDKIRFWLEMNSIVDIFTIPPTFISYYLKSNWLGLRFLRALRLLELPQILQILRVTQSSSSLKFFKLLSIVITTWFTAAGFIHLVENSGDPWLENRNSQNLTYFESIYLVMATTSTVGFGDVVAKTTLGRTFIMFFTLGSLILFANHIPEIVELLINKRKYISSYEVLKGKKFIVVCGNITVDSVTAFLRNFLRHKSGEINTEIVFLGEVPPSLELQTIFKCYMAYTTFVCGSALRWEDLRRVGVKFAEACLIIANPLCSDSHAEDTSNIMRVLSIKNYNPDTRVIIQILQSHNKDFLPKIPKWNWAIGDNIICFAELKLGLIAQGCLVPGLCTFLTSLFLEQNSKVSPKHPWQKIFVSGLRNKIVTQHLSDDLAGMTFPEVCRAFFYCATCHSDVNSPELIGRCTCKNKSQEYIQELKMISSMNESHETEMPVSFEREQTSNLSFAGEFSWKDSEGLDSSGMFYWCGAIPLEKVILKRTDKLKPDFRNHIVACIFGDANSPLMGLQNFVMPLRASNFTQEELKDIVFIGSLDYLQKEWRFLRNFPQIYILPGSALYAGDLHAVNIEECAMCAVLSSPSTLSSQNLVDVQIIMATLNIGSLRISCSDPTIPESGWTTDESGKSNYRRIPILTELKNPSNIHFIEQLGGMEGRLPGTRLHLSTSFSMGSVFSGSFLDSLLATAFYNYRILELLQMLVTGGSSSQKQKHLDKHKILKPSLSGTAVLSRRKRCKLGLLSLNQSILLDIEPKETFGQVFCGLLDGFGILCLGLYRMIDDKEHNPEYKRFVITRPANEFKLLTSDLVYCAIPFNISCYKNDNSSEQNVYESADTSESQEPSVINRPPTADPLNTPVPLLKTNNVPVHRTKRHILTKRVKISQQTQTENENRGESTK